MYKCIQKYMVETSEETLLNFLFENLSDWSHSKIKRTLVSGCIFVNDRSITQFDYLLPLNAIVKVCQKDHSVLNSPYVRIVYEDRWLMVIEKREGILSMATNHKSFCVKTILDDYLKQKKECKKAHVVHRLDRETSGLMVYAKDKETEMLFEEHWHEMVYDRRYIAILQGVLSQSEGTQTSWLKENKSFFVYSSPKQNDGKLAITHYHVVRSSDKYTLTELKLETGRKNQIRVHMQDLGHPVIGDLKYGATENPIGRLALHAFRLYFYHPVTKQKMEFETGIPSAFTKLFRVKRYS